MRLVALALVLSAGCSDAPTTADSARHLTFRASFVNVDPQVESAHFGAKQFGYASAKRIIVEQAFDDYSAGLDAGALTIEFLGAGGVVSSGKVSVGACQLCVSDGCPSLDEIEFEIVDYDGVTDVTPNTYGCFHCADGSKNQDVCP